MAYPYCSECKGTKAMCGQDHCPLLADVRGRASLPKLSGRSLQGPSPPSVFVGRFGYPRITIGPLASPAPLPMAERLEDPSFLNALGLEEVYSIRSSLVRGRSRLDVRTAKADPLGGSEPLMEVEDRLGIGKRRILSSIQEMSMSSRSMDAEMISRKDLKVMAPIPSLDMIMMPMGPSIDMLTLKVIDNPRIPRPVDRAVSDTDMIANEGVLELYREGIREEHISRLFSVGLLGGGRRRRLVPTRWSITAVDDTLSKQLKERALGLTPLDCYHLYSCSSFGNHFLIALYPPPFRFEMAEQWQKGSLWGEGDVIHDWEGPRGRTGYADAITGAYYAARLSTVDHLLSIGRNAGATVIRWITDEYWAPLGVWVIREALRKAFLTPPRLFNDRASLIQAIDASCGIRNWRRSTRFLGPLEDMTLDRYI
ncbi:MAG: hypothetical protein QCI82_05465 [Candidatus Thermoplasmatota archaeon]|nr:hypothetical protein [Candidatus Thermoplasmatota archaeon]